MGVVPLRSRDARGLVGLLIAALGGGAAIAALALTVVFGIGVAPEPAWNSWLVGIAVLAFVPAIIVCRELQVVKRPAELTVGHEALTITYPELLREPLTVPRHALRSALVGDVHASLPRRLHATAAPGP